MIKTNPAADDGGWILMQILSQLRSENRGNRTPILRWCLEHGCQHSARADGGMNWVHAVIVCLNILPPRSRFKTFATLAIARDFQQFHFFEDGLFTSR